MKTEKFTVKQLAESKRFRNVSDVVYAVLEDGKAYSIKETEQKINEYMKGKVTD